MLVAPWTNGARVPAWMRDPGPLQSHRQCCGHVARSRMFGIRWLGTWLRRRQQRWARFVRAKRFQVRDNVDYFVVRKVNVGHWRMRLDEHIHNALACLPGLVCDSAKCWDTDRHRDAGIVINQVTTVAKSLCQCMPPFRRRNRSILGPCTNPRRSNKRGRQAERQRAQRNVRPKTSEHSSVSCYRSYSRPFNITAYGRRRFAECQIMIVRIASKLDVSKRHSQHDIGASQPQHRRGGR
jgi:hypothetical protein